MTFQGLDMVVTGRAVALGAASCPTLCQIWDIPGCGSRAASI